MSQGKQGMAELLHQDFVSVSSKERSRERRRGNALVPKLWSKPPRVTSSTSSAAM